MNTYTFREFHWLPIQWRVKFEHASPDFMAMHTDTYQPYLSRLFVPYHPSRVLTSSLSANKFLALIFFSVLALSVQLPQPFGTPFRTQSVRVIGLRYIPAAPKTHLFQVTFNTPTPPSGKLKRLGLT